MDEINLAQYSSAFQRFWAIFAFHQMSESAKSPNSLRLLIETAFFDSLSVDSSYRMSSHSAEGLRLTGRLRAAALAGLLAGVLGFALFGLSFIIIDMVFFDIVRRQPEKIFNFSHSGYQDMRAYLFDSTVRGATVLTFVGGGAGAILGIVGGLLGNRKSLQRRTT